MSQSTMRAIAMPANYDPRGELLNAVQPFVDQIEPMGSQILVGIFVRPDRTASGLYLSEKTRDEDIYQGKVGLVLKKGPLAFVSDENHDFSGYQIPDVGQWVVYRIGDTFPFIMGEHHYRFIEDVAIRAIVHRPDIVL